jgi:hypothetical protein
MCSQFLQLHYREIHMGKQLTKQVFGVPSAEVIGMIDTSDKVQALRATGYRYEARLGELERQFEAKASELRGLSGRDSGDQRRRITSGTARRYQHLTASCAMSCR